MASAQRPILCQKVTTMLKGNAFSIGDRLPGERRLAEIFNTSRNTIREVLCNLETMGYLEIREKSGCYLKSKDGRMSWERLRKRTSLTASRQLIETLICVIPELVHSQAQRLSTKDIEHLENATARLGQAIVNFNLETVSHEYIAFFLALAEASGNDYLILLLKELSIGSQRLEHAGIGLSEVQADSLFAYHVELFNALKNGHPEQAKSLAEHSLQAFHRLVLPES